MAHSNKTAAERHDIFVKVRYAVSNMMGVDPEKVTLETTLITDLGADSLDQVELIMELEDVFDVSILDEDVEKVTTIQDIVNWLAENA